MEVASGIAIVSLIALFLSLLVGAALLLGIKKLFHLEKPTYGKAVIILVVTGIASILSGFIFGFINIAFLASLLVTIATYFAFHAAFKKLYAVNWKKSLSMYIALAVVSVLLVLLIRMFISPFLMKGDSMLPTYQSDDYLLVSLVSKQMKQGDIALHRIPGKPQKETGFVIKRVIGLPGEKVEIREGKVFINGESLSEPYVQGDTQGDISIVLKDSEYFVLGDNRAKSVDSRAYGPVSSKDLVGKILFKITNLAE